MRSLARSSCVLFAALVFTLALSASRSAFAATFTVNNTGDAGDASPGNGTCATSGGVCTLRAALQEANALAGTDTINFGIASGPQTITVTGTPLPISSSMVIDGTTQPGSGPGPFILVDGANSVTAGFDFATVFNLNVTIRGLAIGRFTEAGIKTFQSGTTVRIERCYIGVGLDGVTDLGNGDGIFARISDLGGSTLILGNTSGGGNVISGNQDMALEIVDNGGAGAKLGTLTLQGNIMGLGADGSTAVPNLSGGIRTNLQFGTITIGGSVAGRNIISGNGGSGYITQFFLQADMLILSYNYIGVAQDGITPRGNNGNGAGLVARQYTVESNIIAANTGSGLTFNTSSLVSPIRGNRIGVALDGSAQGNGGAGIVWNSGNGGVIGGPGTDRNIIANNGGTGVRVAGTGRTEVGENSIFNNGQLGIDIGTANVVDANDAGDGDTGSGNNLQNRPVIDSAVSMGCSMLVNGSLNSTPSSSFIIRLFSSTTPDPSGFGEGETYIGTTTVTTNAAGNASFSFNTLGSPIGSYITATATATNGDTSEFSNALVVSSPGTLQFASPGYSTAESGTVTLTVQRVNGAAGAVSVNWTTDPGSAIGGSDYTSASGVLNFADGQTTQTITVSIMPDTLDEFNESFNVVLFNPTGGAQLGSPAISTVIINDDDAAPTVSIADASKNEGDTGNSPLSFTVSLSAPSGQPVSVDYIANSGTATAGSDLAIIAGTITFAPGQTVRTIAIPIVGDTVVEPDETFTVTLSNEVNATIADGTATGTIINDDAGLSLSTNNGSVVEPNSGTSAALFTVTLSAPSPDGVTVSYGTADQPAGAGHAVGGAACTPGVDYQTTSGTLTFSAGERVKTVSVQVCSDSTAEPEETFLLNLSSPVGATITRPQATGTIKAARTPSQLLISELRTSGPAGATDEFVELYNNSDSPLTVLASDASAGWAIVKSGSSCGDTPSIVATIPNGKVIPARGHYLVLGADYSLGSYATGDQTLSSEIEADSNVAVFNTANLINLSTETRLDAVGFGANQGGVCDLLREGTNLPVAQSSTSEYSYLRNSISGLPQDTDDNSADLIVVSTTPGVPVGSTNNPLLGAPGPENLASPITRNGILTPGLVDPNFLVTVAPNRVRSTAPFTYNDPTTSNVINFPSGTLSVRRTYTNNTGSNVTRLRYRIVDMTAGPAPVGVADLRAISSDPQVITVNSSNITLQGTVLEEAPNQAAGGGINSTMSCCSSTGGTVVGERTLSLAQPLAPGQTIALQWLLGVKQGGSFRFYLNIEALP
jgi:CSLREA domain-containing protein